MTRRKYPIPPSYRRVAAMSVPELIAGLRLSPHPRNYWPWTDPRMMIAEPVHITVLMALELQWRFDGTAKRHPAAERRRL